MCFIFCLHGDDERRCTRESACACAKDEGRKGDLQRQDVFRKPPVPFATDDESPERVHTHTPLLLNCRLTESQTHTKTRSYERRLRETHRQRKVMSVTGSYTPLATRGILRSR